MSLAKHRLAAVSILVAGVLGLMAWGRSRANETVAIRAIRDQFQGRWVGTLVQAGLHRKAEGAEAASCRIVFDGKSVEFRRMIGGFEGRGTYLIRPSTLGLGQVDLKLDAGWSIGVFQVDPGRLALALNPLDLPEQLAAPAKRRPEVIRAGDDQHLYVFRRALAGE